MKAYTRPLWSVALYGRVTAKMSISVWCPLTLFSDLVSGSSFLHVILFPKEHQTSSKTSYMGADLLLFTAKLRSVRYEMKSISSTSWFHAMVALP